MVAQLDEHYKLLPKKQILRRLISYFVFEGRPLTTKGRFVNPFLRIIYKTAQVFFIKYTRVSPVFVIGTGRSGTTILGVSLSAHNNVGFLNEPKLIWAMANEKDDLIGSYSDKPALYRLGTDSAPLINVNLINRFYRFYSFVLGVDCILDKYPEMLFRTECLESVLPGSKFLFLYRNGIDVTNSISSWSVRKGTNVEGDTHDWWGVNDRKWQFFVEQVVKRDQVLSVYLNKISEIGNHKHRAAIEWIASMKEGLLLAEKFPNVVRPVSYERYIDDPSYRADLLMFMELNEDEHYERYCNAALRTNDYDKSLMLPDFLVEEFNRVQRLLGYQDMCVSC